MRNFILLFIISSLIISCKSKSTSPPPTTTATSSATATNSYSFQIGVTSYSSSSVYGQLYLNMPDTTLDIYTSNNSDTISGALNLRAIGLGTYTHTNIVGNVGHYLLVNFGNPSGTTVRTFYSKSGTVTFTTYDIVNNTYAGTFSGIMYLSSNPTYTLPLINGAFHYKY